MACQPAGLIGDLTRRWQLEIGRVLPGGTGAYVAEAHARAGPRVVLKLSIPDGLNGHGLFGAELRALLLANGRGFVRILEYDETRRATVQERLGKPLSEWASPPARRSRSSAARYGVADGVGLGVSVGIHVRPVPRREFLLDPCRSGCGRRDLSAPVAEQQVLSLPVAATRPGHPAHWQNGGRWRSAG